LAPGWRVIPFAKGHPTMHNRWLSFGPEVLYWAPKFVQSLWGAKEIFITENGCASDDVVADDGMIYDTDRVMFLRAHLTQLQRATADGVPVKGYFQWSLMDNFEWGQGFGDRFGLRRVLINDSGPDVRFRGDNRTSQSHVGWALGESGPQRLDRKCP
jgi:beta-glucosidase